MFKALSPLFASGIALIALSMPPTPAEAKDEFPSKTITLIVPTTPGSGIDSGTRVLADVLARDLRASVIVENKPGADSIIGVQALLAAPPDGHTVLLIGPSSVAINPVMRDKLAYDPQRDIRPLLRHVSGQAALITAPNSKFKKLEDLLDAARVDPTSVTIANYGGHYKLGALVLEKKSKVQFTHVPYTGPAHIYNAVAAGQVDAAFVDVGGAVPLINTGKLRAIAVTGDSRSAMLPETPTIKEQGVDFNLYVWLGFGIRSETPEPIVQKLSAALLKATQSDKFLAHTKAASGGEVTSILEPELRTLIDKEKASYREVAKSISLR